MTTYNLLEILRSLTGALADHDLWRRQGADGRWRYCVTRQRDGWRNKPPEGVAGWQTTQRAAIANAHEALL